MNEPSFGYQEIEHTADWALRVWAPTLPLLFQLAADGMYALMETSLQPGEKQERVVELEGGDAESLLVGFLSELLYFGEAEGLAFDQVEVALQEEQLRARVFGAPIREQRKEIKAVTYHNLQVLKTENGHEVTIVFDV